MLDAERWSEVKTLVELIEHLIEKGYTLEEAKTIVYDARCK